MSSTSPTPPAAEPTLTRHRSFSRMGSVKHMRSFSIDPSMKRDLDVMASTRLPPDATPPMMASVPGGSVNAANRNSFYNLSLLGNTMRANVIGLMEQLKEYDLVKGQSIHATNIWKNMEKSKDGKLTILMRPNPLFFKPAKEGEALDPQVIPFLSAGGSIFYFACRDDSALTPDELADVDSVINLSSFQNEVTENEVPHIDVYNPDDFSGKYAVIINKCSYILPSMKISHLTPKLLTSIDYLKNCLPQGTSCWEDCTEESTFRITKTIIRFIYSCTVQLKVSRIAQEDLAVLSQVNGIEVHAGLLMERTRRKKGSTDATVKAKSVLMYTQVHGGVLCTNLTVVLNSGIPSVASSIINNFGSQGAMEIQETAMKTRNYLKSKFMLK